MTSLNFTLCGQTPSKKNNKQIFRNRATGRPFIKSSDRYVAWHEENCVKIAEQKRTQKISQPICHKAIVGIKFFSENARRHDLDNMASSVLDLLVDAEILTDDCTKIVCGMILRDGGIDRENPRAEVVIKPNILGSEEHD